MDRLRIEGTRFLDSLGREVHLRGVNLSGSTKTPPHEPTHIVNTFSQHRAVSFVGRPFPRLEAQEHFARLQHWGFNHLRFLVTWEAIEHAGHGIYDTDYLDYLAEMVALAGEYGFYVFIDPHQDVWSRMTGGDGAPGWTLEAVGFDIGNLDLSEAALTMQRRYPDYPVMAWTDNDTRLACMTMFTLFFAGDQLAPQLKIDGIPVQEYLQGAFINAMCQVAERLKNMPHVLGYGSMNEPGKGLIGLQSLNDINGVIQRVIDLSSAEALFVGSGIPRQAHPVKFENDDWHVDKTRSVLLNPYGISAWQSPDHDIWRQHGVWNLADDGEPVVLRDDYFAGVDFLEDGLFPFVERYAQAIRAIDPTAMLFIETHPDEAVSLRSENFHLENIVNAGHWYDVQMLFTNRFDGNVARDFNTQMLIYGVDVMRAIFTQNIKALVNASANMGGIPTLVGEFGLVYRLNDKSAYTDGDFSMHELALSLYYDAMDANLVHTAQWNYTADNSNEWGDNWNLEDLSIFSPDQRHHPADIHSGGRAVKGFSRPHLSPVAGHLIERKFANGDFRAVVEVDTGLDTPTLIYLPDIWYRGGFKISVSSGEIRGQANNHQWFEWWHTETGEQVLEVTLNRHPEIVGSQDI